MRCVGAVRFLYTVRILQLQPAVWVDVRTYGSIPALLSQVTTENASVAYLCSVVAGTVLLCSYCQPSLTAAPLRAWSGSVIGSGMRHMTSECKRLF